MSGIGRGVVVTTWRGRGPSRRPNCSMSQVSCAWRHLPSSSAQAASNCGPRSESGSSAEKAWATAPDGHSRRRSDGCRAWRARRSRPGRPAPPGPAGRPREALRRCRCRRRAFAAAAAAAAAAARRARTSCRAGAAAASPAARARRVELVHAHPRRLGDRTHRLLRLDVAAPVKNRRLPAPLFFAKEPVRSRPSFFLSMDRLLRRLATSSRAGHAAAPARQDVRARPAAAAAAAAAADLRRRQRQRRSASRAPPGPGGAGRPGRDRRARERGSRRCAASNGRPAPSPTPSRPRTRIACAGRSSPPPGRRARQVAPCARRPGTCCSSACGSARGRARS